MIPGAATAISEEHGCSQFDSGTPALDNWLVRRALANQINGASRCYVSCDAGFVVGYHALAASSITVSESQGRFSRNMPDPVPVIILARLAVDRRWQGMGLGRSLFRDAAVRVLEASGIIGVRGMIVHAISAEAQAFYRAMGMQPSRLPPMTLMVSCRDIEARF